MESTKPNIPLPPRNGVYGDKDVYKAYKELYETVHTFMDEVSYDSGSGNLSLGGVASKCKARSKAIVAKAKMLDDMIKAVCVGRK